MGAGGARPVVVSGQLCVSTSHFPQRSSHNQYRPFFFNFQTALFLWEQAEFVAGLGTSKEQFDSWSAEAIKVRRYLHSEYVTTNMSSLVHTHVHARREGAQAQCAQDRWHPEPLSSADRRAASVNVVHANWYTK